MRKLVVAVVIGIIIAGTLVTYYHTSNSLEEEIKVLAAGSLAVPLKKISDIFEKEFGVRVYTETAGSLETVKKVSELGTKADVVAVADYQAIEKYLMPDFTEWYVKFARNELVIAYTDKSKYASEITLENWMKIFKKDVRIGFSSPNDDPCGYRAIMMFYLAEIKYQNGIFRDVVENNTGIRASNGIIEVPDDSSLLNFQGKIFIKQKSVELLADLESGNIDYAIEYLSVAKQHGLSYLRLPDEINLSNSTLIPWYQKVKVKLADGREIQGDAINYGVTIPNNAPHTELAYKFLELLLGEKGNEILSNCGQPPMYEEIGNVPEEIKRR